MRRVGPASGRVLVGGVEASRPTNSAEAVWWASRTRPTLRGGFADAFGLLLLLALLLAIDTFREGGVAAVVALGVGPGGAGPGGLGAPVGPVGGHAFGGLDLDGDGDDLVGVAFPDPAVGGDVGEVAADGGDDVVAVGERAAGRVEVDPADAAAPDLAPG